MQPRQAVALGALLGALGVAAGAFGAHALKETLAAGEHLETWHTAVRYQVWSALALVAHGLFRARAPGRGPAGLLLALGAVLFSGSLYLLALDVAPRLLGPVTPLGGGLMIAGWVSFGVEAAKARGLGTGGATGTS